MRAFQLTLMTMAAICCYQEKSFAGETDLPQTSKDALSTTTSNCYIQVQSGSDIVPSDNEVINSIISYWSDENREELEKFRHDLIASETELRDNNYEQRAKNNERQCEDLRCMVYPEW